MNEQIDASIQHLLSINLTIFNQQIFLAQSENFLTLLLKETDKFRENFCDFGSSSPAATEFEKLDQSFEQMLNLIGQLKQQAHLTTIDTAEIDIILKNFLNTRLYYYETLLEYFLNILSNHDGIIHKIFMYKTFSDHIFKTLVLNKIVDDEDIKEYLERYTEVLRNLYGKLKEFELFDDKLALLIRNDIENISSFFLEAHINGFFTSIGDFFYKNFENVIFFLERNLYDCELFFQRLNKNSESTVSKFSYEGLIKVIKSLFCIINISNSVAQNNSGFSSAIRQAHDDLVAQLKKWKTLSDPHPPELNAWAALLAVSAKNILHDELRHIGQYLYNLAIKRFLTLFDNLPKTNFIYFAGKKLLVSQKRSGGQNRNSFFSASACHSMINHLLPEFLKSKKIDLSKIDKIISDLAKISSILLEHASFPSFVFCAYWIKYHMFFFEEKRSGNAYLEHFKNIASDVLMAVSNFSKNREFLILCSNFLINILVNLTKINFEDGSDLEEQKNVILNLYQNIMHIQAFNKQPLDEDKIIDIQQAIQLFNEYYTSVKNLSQLDIFTYSPTANPLV